MYVYHVAHPVAPSSRDQHTSPYPSPPFLAPPRIRCRPPVINTCTDATELVADRQSLARVSNLSTAIRLFGPSLPRLEEHHKRFSCDCDAGGRYLLLWLSCAVSLLCCAVSGVGCRFAAWSFGFALLLACLQRGGELLCAGKGCLARAACRADRGGLVDRCAVLRDEFGWHRELLAAEAVVVLRGHVRCQGRVLALWQRQFEGTERHVGDGLERR